MSRLRKLADIILDVNSNVVSSITELVVGEVIKLDGVPHIITSVDYVDPTYTITGASPTLPGTITEATTEFKTKLTVIDDIPDANKIIPGDMLLIDGSNYEATSITVGNDTTGILDILGDGSCIAAYTLNNTLGGVDGEYDGTDRSSSYIPIKYGNGAKSNGTEYIAEIPLTISDIVAMTFTTKMVDGEYAAFGNEDSGGRVHLLAYYNESRNACDIGVRWRDGSGGTYNYYVAYSDSLTVAADDLVFVYFERVTGSNMDIIYVNGIHLNQEEGITRSGFSDKLSIAPMCLGGTMGNSTSTYHVGTIDQIRMYNRSLSVGEMAILSEEVEPHFVETTPTLPGTITNVHKREMLAKSLDQLPTFSVASISNAESQILVDSILILSDSIDITISVPIVAGDSLYISDGTTITTITASSVTNNGNGTYTCEHGQAYIPLFVYMEDSLSVHIKDDSDTYKELSKNSVSHLNILNSLDPFEDGSLVHKFNLNSDLVDLMGNTDLVGTYAGTPMKFGDGLDATTEDFEGPLSEIRVEGTKTVSYFLPIDGTEYTVNWYASQSPPAGGACASYTTWRFLIGIDADGHAIMFGNGTDNEGCSNVTDSYTSAQPYTGDFLHCVFETDGKSTVTAWFNGELLGTSTNTVAVPIDDYNEIQIGFRELRSIGGGTGKRVNIPAKVDQLEVYNRSLTDDERGLLLVQIIGLKETYDDYTFPVATGSVMHYIRQRYSGVSMKSLSADFIGV